MKSLFLLLLFFSGLVFAPVSALTQGRETILDERVVSERESFRLVRAAGEGMK